MSTTIFLKTLRSSGFFGVYLNLNILMVDRISKGREFTNKFGVGLARKIGCDLAVACHAKGLLSTQWVCSTDADALVPVDYFYQDYPGSAGVLLCPFHHRIELVKDKFEKKALELYERWLHYYVEGLSRAGSSYASFL